MSELCRKYDLILPLSTGDEHFHVAVRNGGRRNIVGYVCSIKKEEEVKKDLKIYAEISHVVVLATYQRLGIATKLVTAAHKDLEQVCLLL
jgi:ribosomal protein S18 acetylase RimI-like enzyme